MPRKLENRETAYIIHALRSYNKKICSKISPNLTMNVDEDIKKSENFVIVVEESQNIIGMVKYMVMCAIDIA